MPATRADVAREAGVSPALVSYVLNDGPRPVSAQKRARVLQAVKDLGYRPNRIARSLRAARTNSIAMLMPDHVNPYYAELAEAVESEAFARDYMLMIGTDNNNRERARDFLQAFVDRHVDGLLLISAMSPPDVSIIHDEQIPIVVLNPLHGSGFSSVTTDNRLGARIAVEHLLGHGRTRPVCISGLPEIIAVQDREAGWEDALEAANVEPLQAPTHGSFSRINGYEAMLSLLGGAERPDAVFAASDAQAMGAILACEESGIRAGTDISVVSFDGTGAGHFNHPRLTAVDQDVHEIARQAVEVLLHRISDGGPVEHRVLEPALRVGASCGCGPHGS